ncbi:hypothetical protein P8825_15410 [Shouchella clausii]|uniref:hypothetical protein n=1 Tax=Shouchella clausii TaxID=79880 RepID=UPI002DBEC185|nr:hypothetical protein [Shouchella clausii]MEB5480953.1 hypothetical protein [Shouchella clausii]
MKKVAIKVTLEKEIWLTEESWEGFGEQLPLDIDDLEMLEDECLLSNIELKGAGVVAEWDS